jgi:sugar phosphate isomerase/epimerase
LEFSLSTGTLYIYPLALVFRWAREAGFDGVELVANPEAILRGGEVVREIASDQGLAIYSVHPTLVPLPGWRERHDGLDTTIELARDAGASLVVMHTPRSESLDNGEGRAFQETVARWAPRLADGGPRLAVENKAIRVERDRDYALTPLDRLRRFADLHDLGLVLDTTHAGTAGEDLLEAYRMFDGRLANVHLSDMGGWVPFASSARMQAIFGQHRYPGGGHLPLQSLLAGLRSGGYAGPVTLEVHPIALRIWWPPALRRGLARALQWMKAAAGLGVRDSEQQSPVW